jgi:hypothetical protein
MFGHRKFLLSLVAFFASATVCAAPLEWAIDSLAFNDGGTASGTFTYNADTNTYSNIDIVTTVGSAFEGAAYNAVNTSAPNSSDFLGAMIFPLGGLPTLQLSFAASLTNDGGNVAIDGYAESMCGDACEFAISDYRYISAGQISAVPVPAAVWLFGSALAGLGWIRRRQTV